MDFRSLSPSVKATLLVLALALIGLGAYLLWPNVFKLNTGTNMAPGTTNNSSAPSSREAVTEATAIAGTLTAVTATSITIKLRDSTQQTFSLSSSTLVISQVKSGEVGKTLAQVVEAPVLVIPKSSNPAAADSIMIVPATPPVTNSIQGTPVSLTGTIVSKTASSITLKPQGGPATASAIKVLITKNTLVLSNVLAGQTGKTLNDATPGILVNVFGTTGTAGVTANTLQLLIPLNDLGK
mgnify:CR=1 FL=1